MRSMRQTLDTTKTEKAEIETEDEKQTTIWHRELAATYFHDKQEENKKKGNAYYKVASSSKEYLSTKTTLIFH